MGWALSGKRVSIVLKQKACLLKKDHYLGFVDETNKDSSYQTKTKNTQRNTKKHKDTANYQKKNVLTITIILAINETNKYVTLSKQKQKVPLVLKQITHLNPLLQQAYVPLTLAPTPKSRCLHPSRSPPRRRSEPSTEIVSPCCCFRRRRR